MSYTTLAVWQLSTQILLSQRDTAWYSWPRLNVGSPRNTFTHWRVWPCALLDMANAGRTGNCSVNGRSATVSDNGIRGIWRARCRCDIFTDCYLSSHLSPADVTDTSAVAVTACRVHVSQHLIMARRLWCWDCVASVHSASGVIYLSVAITCHIYILTNFEMSKASITSDHFGGRSQVQTNRQRTHQSRAKTLVHYPLISPVVTVDG